MSEILEHQLEEVPAVGLTCKVCGHSWKRQPGYACPGVPWYEWDNAPEGLKTKTQLRAQGLRLKKGARPAGCIWYGKKQSWIWLYGADQAGKRPEPTEKQLAAAQRAREKQKALRTCSRCGVEQQSLRDLIDGVCEECSYQEFISEQRQRAVNWAKRILAAPEEWMILDTETTGLGNEAEIVQVAVLNPATGEEYQSLVRPLGAIPPEATAIHGITNEMVQDAPEMSEVALQLASLLTGKLFVVMYNAEFDSAMLQQTHSRHGLEIHLTPSCAMKWYAIWFGEWSDYHNSFKWQPLPGGDHSALGDCRATLALIRKMAGVQESEEE